MYVRIESVRVFVELEIELEELAVAWNENFGIRHFSPTPAQCSG